MGKDKSDKVPSGIASDAMVQAFNIGVFPETTEERPEARSLQIADRSPGLLGSAPSISKPSLGIDRVSTTANRGCSKGSAGMKHQWDETVVPVSWDVKSDDLEIVPDDFPLERTHRLISGVDVQVVASRISDAFRSHSVEAVFKSKPPKAKCKTHDLVRFRMRLYSGNENGDPVIVEVQRRSGSASSFMRVCRAILDTAEGKSSIDSALRKMPPYEAKPAIKMNCLSVLQEPQENEKELVEQVFQNSMTMLRSNKRDINLLGLENLCLLTDPFKTNPSVCLEVSKAIVLGNESHEAREEITVLIDRDVFSADVVDDPLISNHLEVLRQCALSLFANALSLCAKEGCLGTEFDKQPWFRDCLVPLLLAELKHAERNACNATKATTCIHSIAICSSVAKDFLIQNGFMEPLQDAHAFGAVCNDLLANETERCISALQ